jgi:hypothetical protein
VVQQAVQDGIGDGGLPDDSVPVFDRALAGDDGGSLVVTVLDDFEEIIALRIIERSQKQFVYDEQLDFGQSGQHFEIRAIGFSLKKHFRPLRGREGVHGAAANGPDRLLGLFEPSPQIGIFLCRFASVIRYLLLSFAAQVQAE